MCEVVDTVCKQVEIATLLKSEKTNFNDDFSKHGLFFGEAMKNYRAFTNYSQRLSIKSLLYRNTINARSIQSAASGNELVWQEPTAKLHMHMLQKSAISIFTIF